MTLPGRAGRARWIQNGYDSWSFTGVERIDPGYPPPDRVDGAVRACGNNFKYWTTCAGVSWWFGAMGTEDRGPGLVWGALSAKNWKTYGAAWIDGDDGIQRFAITQGTPGDPLTIKPSASVALEPIWLMISPHPARDLRAYAEAAAQETPPREAREAPFGWSTWYDYFSEINRDIVLDNCRIFQAWFPDVENAVCQIDDGYERYFGEWTAYTDGFPGGLAPVAADINARG
ncbi:MAG: hypothetical protein M5R36_14685 [Deltaproteobacteria bacterium]|nr:hypothetical protein [Deltaproteobacteria bacterium]